MKRASFIKNTLSRHFHTPTLIRVSLGLAAFLCLNIYLHAAEISIAAASDLKFALDDLITEFRRDHPAIRIGVTYGSSGNFYAQLQNKAPFDLYFSADIQYPRKLAEAGHALDTNVFVYALGRIVLWTPKESSLGVEKTGIKALLAPEVKQIAIANPRHAPYGRAAVEAMKSLQVYNQVEAKLVYGENIAQTAQFLQSGSADIGIIALSLATAPQMRETGQYWEFPLDSYPEMEQGGVILKWSKNPEAARVFRDFVLAAQGRELLKRHGFSLPENARK